MPAALMDLLSKIQGKDPDKEDKIRREAEASQAKYERSIGEKVPEEAGIVEGIDEGAEHRKLGWQMGAAPQPPKQAADDVAKLTFEQAKKAFNPKRLEAIGNDIRTQGYSHIKDGSGKLIATIGEHTPAGQGMKQMAKEGLVTAAESGPTLRYAPDVAPELLNVAKTPISKLRDRGPQGPAKEWLEKKKVDIRNKTGNQVMDELREMNKSK